MRTSPRTPPTTPPAIAPTFDEDFFAEPEPEPVVPPPTDGLELVALAVPELVPVEEPGSEVIVPVFELVLVLKLVVVEGDDVVVALPTEAVDATERAERDAAPREAERAATDEVDSTERMDNDCWFPPAESEESEATEATEAVD